MKIILSILSYQGCANFKMLSEAQKQTFCQCRIPEIDIKFYYGKPLRKNNDFDCYYPFIDNMQNILHKTVAHFEDMLQYPFDYLYRSNSSSYTHQKNAIKWLEDKPRENFYAGIEGSYGIHFMLGNGFILSRDLVQLIVDKKNELNHSLADDVAIGKLMTDYKIPFTNLFMFAVVQYNGGGLYEIWKRTNAEVNIYKDVTELKKEYFEGIFHYRCKHPTDRGIDIKTMNKLHKLFKDD